MLYAAIINFLAPGISLSIGFTMYCLIYFLPIFFEAHDRKDFAEFTSKTYCLHFVLFLFFLRKSLPAFLPDLSIFKSHFTPSILKSKSDCPALASDKRKFVEIANTVAVVKSNLLIFIISICSTWTT